MLVCLAASAAAARTDVVSDVAVVGNVNIAREAIVSVTSLHPGGPFSVAAAARDAAAISDLGYFRRASHREEETALGVRIIFEVVENPKVTRINVIGNTLVPSPKILELMTTKVGDVLNRLRIGRDFDRVQDYYHSRQFLAYINANQNQLITDDGVLTVPIREVVVEGYRVVGVTKTKPETVLREIRMPIGSPYDGKQIQLDLQRIYNLGILEDLTYRVEPGTTPGGVIVVFEAKEQKTAQVQLSGGYSTEDGIIGGVGMTESNLRGTGASVGVDAKLSGRSRSAGIPAVSLDLNYYQPWLDKRHTSLTANLHDKYSTRFSTSSSSTAYEARKGLFLALARPMSGDTRVQFSVRSESNQSYSQSSGSGEYRVDAEQGYNVSSIGFSLVSDSRDSQQDPAAGAYVSAGAETGLSRVGGAAAPGSDAGRSGAFVKPALESRWFLPLAPRKSIGTPTRGLAFRLKAATAVGPLGFSDQYFVGGSDTLRGYSEDRFWGKHSLLANLEYRMPVAKQVQSVFFVDAGDAWGSSLRGNPQRYADYLNWSSHSGDANGDGVPDPQPAYSVYDAYEYQNPQHGTFQVNLGVGAGLRLKTPIGPIRLDYGIGKQGGRFYFGYAQSF